jgi:hypothetical protein
VMNCIHKVSLIVPWLSSKIVQGVVNDFPMEDMKV